MTKPARLREGTMDQAHNRMGRPPIVPPTTRYQVTLFGPFRVLRNGIPLDEATWGRASAKSLLKWFILKPGCAFSASELSAVLWPGRDHASCANKLHVTLHALRRALEPDLPPRRLSTYICAGRGHYWFDLTNDWWSDIAETGRLRQAAASASVRGDTTAAISFYERLLDYYDLGFLPEDIYDDVFAHPRAKHEHEHDDVLHSLLDLYRLTGRQFEALTCALAILDRVPYSHAAVLAAAEIHLQQGDVTAAQSQLDRFIDAVTRDLGVDPDPEVRALHELVHRTP